MASLAAHLDLAGYRFGCRGGGFGIGELSVAARAYCRAFTPAASGDSPPKICRWARRLSPVADVAARLPHRSISRARPYAERCQARVAQFIVNSPIFDETVDCSQNP